MTSATQTNAGLRIPPLRRRARQVWLILHVLSSVGWFGVIMAVLALSYTGMTSDDLELVSSVYTGAVVLAETYFLAGTLLVLITGLVLGLGTKWGVVKYWWVLVKLAVGVALLVAALGNLKGHVLETSANADAMQPLPSSDDVSLFGMVAVVGGLAVFAAVLSVLKPWGRINWRRAQPATPAGRTESTRTQTQESS